MPILLSTSKIDFIVYLTGLLILLHWLIVLIYSRTPPRIPQVHIPEEPWLQVASTLSNEINRVFAVLRNIASGRDLKKFLIVCIFNVR